MVRTCSFVPFSATRNQDGFILDGMLRLFFGFFVDIVYNLACCIFSTKTNG